MKKYLRSFLCIMLIAVTILSLSVDAFALDKNLFKTEYSNYLRNNGLSSSGNGATEIVRAAKAMKGKSGKNVASKGQWCASFVSCCAETVGQSKAIPYNTAVKPICDGIKKNGGRVIYNKNSSGSINSALPGDIVAYNNWAHVEIVTGVVKNSSGAATGIKSIGGNTGSGSSHSSRVVKEHNWSKSSVRYIIRPNYNNTIPSPAPAGNYLDLCVATDTYLLVSANNSSDYIMTLPCSNSTDSGSKTVRRLTAGETLTALKIYKNTAGNYWYNVKASDGKTGFVYGGCVSVIGVPNDCISGNAKLATTSPKLGKAVAISGTLKTISLKIGSVTGVLTGSGNSKQTKTVTVNAKSFGIQSSAINKNLKFGKLKAGAGNLQLTVALIGKATNGTSLYDQTINVSLSPITFTVKK